MSIPGPSTGVDDWRFTVPLTINHHTENPLSCVNFDPYEELVWCGSQTGKVTSFSATNQFSRYSAFVSSKISSIHAMEITEDMVFTLTDTMLKGSSKQGVPMTKYTSPSFGKMEAICRMPNSSTFILGGSTNKKMIQYDFSKEKEIRTADIAEDGVKMIRYNGTSVFAADCYGKINVKNPKNFETVHTFNCHGDRILDFDVSGNKLITCGSANKMKGDIFVKVYDLRMNKALAPIPLAFAPRFCRFMTSYCERVVLTSENGHVKISDLNSHNIGFTMMVDTNGLTCFNFSTSKQYMAFGDFQGSIQLFSNRDQATFNNESFETQFAYPQVGPPLSFSVEDNGSSLATIQLPFPNDEYLSSDWPAELTQPMYRKMKEPVEHKDVKMLHYVTHVKNPRVDTKLKYHNVVPYILEAEPEKDAAGTEVTVETGRAKVNKFYKRCPTLLPLQQRQRQPEEERKTHVYNTTTNHVGIASTHYMNALVNPIVQAFYHIIPIRNLALSHICGEDHCLACELRFLFQTMSDYDRNSIEPISSNNLAWSLAGKGIQLMRTDVFGAFRQILTGIMRDIGVVCDTLKPEQDGVTLGDDEINCLRTRLDRIFRCVRCGAMHNSVSNGEHIITLNYATGTNQPTFCQMIEKGLHLGAERGSSEEMMCEECQVTSRMEGKRKIRGLPSILLIDTNSTNQLYDEFWKRVLPAYERKPTRKQYMQPPESPLDKKSCRFGHDCRNKKACKYNHGRFDWDTESLKLMDDVDLDGWTHYLPTRIAAQVNEGIVRMSDVSDIPDYDEPTATVYELVIIVDSIGNGEYPVKWSHPITYLKDVSNENLPWVIINERLITRVHSNEALHIDARFKLPLLVGYQKKGFNIKEEKRTPIPESLFFDGLNLAKNEARSSVIDWVQQLPGEGELVAIDAEFIRIRSEKVEFDKKNTLYSSVGRVSCLDSTGNRIIFDDHCIVLDSNDVGDYLTPFSGIVCDDLDVTKSTKYLTTLKRVLLKIWILVQRKCIFVGHALNNDFSVLNIVVPENQIIDTVNLMRLDSQRLLSLQFLALHLLGDRIQEESHDSVVDARYALKLYRKYQELVEKNALDSEKRRVYGYIPACPSPMKSVSPANSQTDQK